MLPMERLRRIKKLILKEQKLKIADLSEQFGVSQMTIHRDIKPLVKDGLVVKTFGGIMLAREEEKPKANTCVYCSRPIHTRLAYRLILANNNIEMACCAHCGLLRQRQLGDEVIQSICKDFLTQTTISAPLSYYIMDTSINIGCCQPQVLAFEYEEDANKFIKGFNGNVYTFNKAMEAVYHRMSV